MYINRKRRWELVYEGGLQDNEDFVYSNGKKKSHRGLLTQVHGIRRCGGGHVWKLCSNCLNFLREIGIQS